MDTETGKRLFQEAGAKFEGGDYEGALVHLRELDASYPDKRHILFPMVRSLAALGKCQEAFEINQRVIELFDYAPAKEIHADLQRKFMDSMTVNPDAHLQSEIPGHAIHTPSPSGLPDLDIQFTPPPRTAPPPLAQQTGNDWFPYAIWIGLPIAGFIVMVATTVVVERPSLEWTIEALSITDFDESNPESAPQFPPQPTGTYTIILVTAYIYSYILACLCGHWALRAVNALRFDDFGENMKDVAVYTFYCYILALIPILGWIAALYILNRHYELGPGRLANTVVHFIIYGIGLSLLTVFPYLFAVKTILADLFEALELVGGYN